MQIFRLAGRRLLSSVPTLLILLAGLFVLIQFAPGDAVDALMSPSLGREGFQAYGATGAAKHTDGGALASAH